MTPLRLAPWLLIVVAVLSGMPCAAWGQQPFTNQVPGLKADSLVIFGYYFTWPDGAVPGNDFVIGVLGNAPFHSDRITTNFGKIGDRRIRVLSFDSADDYRPCHILFVADGANAGSREKTPDERLAAAIRKLNGAPVLVVSETAGFARRGSMINFVVDAAANRLKTEINEGAVRRGRIGFTRHYLQYRGTDKCIPVVDAGEVGGQGVRP